MSMDDARIEAMAEAVATLHRKRAGLPPMTETEWLDWWNADANSERYREDMRAALAASTPADDGVEKMRDPRLTYDDRGDIEVFCVWSLKPGQPQIVAICTSEIICEHYKSYVERHHRGRFYVERVWLDHAFGRRDVQSAIYHASARAALGDA